MSFHDPRAPHGDDAGRPAESHELQEGGWHKPVAPPVATMRPAGLPPTSAAPRPKGGQDG